MSCAGIFLFVAGFPRAPRRGVRPLPPWRRQTPGRKWQTLTGDLHPEYLPPSQWPRFALKRRTWGVSHHVSRVGLMTILASGCRRWAPRPSWAPARMPLIVGQPLQFLSCAPGQWRTWDVGACRSLTHTRSCHLIMTERNQQGPR